MNQIVLRVAIILFALPTAARAAVPVVANEAPAHPPVTIELEEIWRVGGEEDDHIFGVMIDARSDADGNTYLLDQQLSRINVVSPTGQYLRELGREGEGPGECRMPQTMTMMPDGTVAMGQRFPGKFVRLNRDGSPAPSLEARLDAEPGTGNVMLLSGRHRGGNLLACLMKQVPEGKRQARISYLVGLGADGLVRHRYAEHRTYLDFNQLHLAEKEMVAPFVSAHTVGPDGRVFFTPERNAYRIEVLHADGSADRVITRRFDNPERDQVTRDRMAALFEEQKRAISIPMTYEVEPVDPAITEIIALSDGGLQVAHSRSGRDLPDGIFASYDVFDAAGRWSHERRVRCDADPDNDGLIFLDDGRILLVRGLQVARLTASGNGGQVGQEDEAPVMEIICCRARS